MGKDKRICIYNGCNKRWNFGKKGSKLAEFCKSHAPEDYVDIKSKRCLKCDKIPVFGKPGSKQADYCKSHAPENYIDVKSKTCLKCDKRPIFGKPGRKKVEFCKSHAPEDYVNVKNKICLKCDKQTTFEKQGSKKVKLCKTHAPKDYVDVKKKICAYKNCKTRAHFGYLFQLKIHCAKHRNNNEYSKNNPKCSTDKCKQLPIYTVKDDTYPRRCEDHKLDKDINIVEKKCSLCQLMWIIPEDQTMCNSCRDYNKPTIRNRKENKIGGLLYAHEFKYESHDRPMDLKCSRKRPDFVLDYNFYKVIVEVDENQHMSYPCECEKVRMIQIQQDAGMNVLFIRFNPDPYKNNLGERIKYYTGREKKLIDLLQSLKNTERRSHYLEVIYLFYDGFDGSITIDNIYY